jgi:hypothetical protein
MPPGMYENMVMTAQRQIMYLSNNLPAIEQPGLFDHVEYLPPSMSEMDVFVRRMNAIEDPMSVLENTANLTVTPEEVDALAAVYPEMYRHIQQVTSGMITDIQSLPPYQARIQLGNLLQIPADESLSPSFLSTMQSRGAQTNQQHQARFSQGSRRSVQVSGNTYSEAQQIEMRL